MGDTQPGNKWLIDEHTTLESTALAELDRELAKPTAGLRSAGQHVPTLAVTFHDVIIHDNRKWFGDADVRLDALVVTGTTSGDDPTSFYMPRTQSFPRVRDGQRLPISEGGLLAFHGPALHFLDILLMVSRNRRDSDDLASLLSSKLGSQEVQGAVSTLVGLAVATPQAALVAGALGAAATLGDLAYRALSAATGNTIGLYRGAHLQVRDGFGIGPHPTPPQESYRVNDLSFSYEISLEG